MYISFFQVKTEWLEFVKVWKVTERVQGSDGEPVAASGGLISKATTVYFMQNHYRTLPTQVQYTVYTVQGLMSSCNAEL